MIDAIDDGSGVSASRGTRWADAWILVGLITIAVGLPIAVGIISGSISIPHNDDFAYRRSAMTLYQTGRLEFTGWGIMTLAGQLIASLPLLWLTNGSPWAFAGTTAIFAITAVVASYSLARHVLSPGRAGLAVLLTILVPGFLLYTTAFMTEIPALAMEMLCLAVGAGALQRGPGQHRWAWLAVSLAIGCYAFSIREFALAAPIAVLAAAALSERAGRWLPYAIGFAAVVVACGTIYLFTRGLPGQGDVVFAFPTAISVRRTLDSFGFLCFPLAGAFLLGIASWAPHWWRTRGHLGLVLGSLGGAAFAAVIYWDQVRIFVGQSPGNALHVFAGNVFGARGAIGTAVFAGGRPVLYLPPSWNLMNGLTLLTGIGALIFLGAALTTERHRLLRAIDFRSRPTPLGSVAGMLAIFIVVFAAGTIAAGLTSDIYDRYTWPLALPLATLLLLRPEAEPSNDIDRWSAGRRASFGWRRAGIVITTGALVAATGMASVALLLNANAFDAAKWRMGDEAVRLGFDAGTVDAGFEWIGFHATGLADNRARRISNLTTYAAKFSSFRQCAVATSTPIDSPGFTLLSTRTNAYRLLLFAGPMETMYLYRFAGPACPAGR